ncbi:MAG TPA: HEAT repeat domain-containing protein, partial [Verrucomicrobiae bacterium]|nr:HEAT repeat domain-containing protein [Verrucomicrobiae bacterium]
PTTESAKFLLKHLQKYNESRETSVEYLRHAARYLPDSEIGALADFTRTKFGDDLDFQFALFKSVREGMAQRGASTMESLRGWAADVAARLAAGGDEKSQPWFNTPVEGKANVTNPWFLQERASADGDKTAKFLCSLPPGGEQLTGILRSQPFAVPARLSFFLAGHDGYPNKPPQKKNVVRLRAADTREVLAEAFPPRNDMAQPVSWDLSAHAGRQGYLEIVDGDDGKAYAWLAVGRFKPEVVKLPIVDPRFIGQRKQEVAELARSFKLTSLEEPLTGWLADKDADPDVRAGAARAVMTLNPEAHVALVGRICADASEPAALRQKVAETLGEVNSPATRTALIESLCAAPERLQVKMALALAGSADGAEALLQLTETGKASPRLLLERSIKERLTAVKPERYVERVEKLTKGLAPLNQELQKVIDQRRVAFDPAKTSAALGAKVFTKNCTVCHSMDNQGGAVGPHLDGVGNRGLERLLEDVLDPNRIVDPGFRYSIVSLKNGEVVTGLLRREEGQVLVFADATGKEISVPKKDIESRVESQSSLMPDNFSELIPVEDFNNLMAFLLSKGSQSTAKR